MDKLTRIKQVTEITNIIMTVMLASIVLMLAVNAGIKFKNQTNMSYEFMEEWGDKEAECRWDEACDEKQLLMEREEAWAQFRIDNEMTPRDALGNILRSFGVVAVALMIMGLVLMVRNKMFLIYYPEYKNVVESETKQGKIKLV